MAVAYYFVFTIFMKHGRISDLPPIPTFILTTVLKSQKVFPIGMLWPKCKKNRLIF